jgi:hypothetical protein
MTSSKVSVPASASIQNPPAERVTPRRGNSWHDRLPSRIHFGSEFVCGGPRTRAPLRQQFVEVVDYCSHSWTEFILEYSIRTERTYFPFDMDMPIRTPLLVATVVGWSAERGCADANCGDCRLVSHHVSRMRPANCSFKPTESVQLLRPATKSKRYPTGFPISSS